MLFPIPRIASIIPTALEQPFVLEQYFRAKVENITSRFADHVLEVERRDTDSRAYTCPLELVTAALGA